MPIACNQMVTILTVLVNGARMHILVLHEVACVFLINSHKSTTPGFGLQSAASNEKSKATIVCSGKLSSFCRSRWPNSQFGSETVGEDWA